VTPALLPIVNIRQRDRRAGLAPEADVFGHMKPGLRGRYRVQSPKSRVAISTIGSVMRIPCSTARLSAMSHVPGRNADTCGEPLSAAKATPVVHAARMVHA